MSEYEFVEKVSEYTKRRYGFTVSWGRFDEITPMIEFSYGRSGGGSNFDFFYGHLPFEEGVYAYVNEIIEKYNLR